MLATSNPHTTPSSTTTRPPMMLVRTVMGSPEPFVAFESRRSRFADHLMHLCIQAGFAPLVRQQVTEVQTLLALVGAGFGVALLPGSTANLAPPGVVFRPLEPALPAVPLYVHYRVDDTSPVLKAFLETLREVSAGADAAAIEPQPVLVSR